MIYSIYIHIYTAKLMTSSKVALVVWGYDRRLRIRLWTW